MFLDFFLELLTNFIEIYECQVKQSVDEMFACGFVHVQLKSVKSLKNNFKAEHWLNKLQTRAVDNKQEFTLQKDS